MRDEESLIAFYRSAVNGTEVHSIHTEAEGMALFPFFRRQMRVWLREGVRFITLQELAQEALAKRSEIPVYGIARSTLPGRAGQVTVSCLKTASG